jgi:hypothetical protein
MTMRPCHPFQLACAYVLAMSLAPASFAQDEPAEGAEDANLPAVKFFYYDAGAVEWAVSAEPERLQRHLASNADSQQLFEEVNHAVAESPTAGNSAAQMTRWIESERQRFDQSRREVARMRMAEGIIAYLRTHDFSIPNLVRDLKHRSGASAVELVAIHLRDAQANSSFKLKVVLVDPKIDIAKQGFNVNLPSANASYTVVTYALGVALYEVHEIIHGGPTEKPEEDKSLEPLPVPEPLARPQTEGTPALLQTPQ